MIELPPIRELVLPDPGYVLVDADFERADAQIVAWSANEQELKRIFQSGHDIYTENAEWLWGSCTPQRRQAMKSAVHLSSYGGKARTLASTLNCPVATAEKFQNYWFGRFPGILRWHRQIEQQLHFAHNIRNVWGFRRWYFDRLDGLLPEALAWLGQSGVAGAIDKAILRVYRERPGGACLKLQNHDSLLVQVPEANIPGAFVEIAEAMRICIPFADPLHIPVSLKWSPENWGRMRKVDPLFLNKELLNVV